MKILFKEKAHLLRVSGLFDEDNAIIGQKRQLFQRPPYKPGITLFPSIPDQGVAAMNISSNQAVPVPLYSKV